MEQEIKKQTPVIENKIYFNKDNGMGAILENFKKMKKTFQFTYTANKGYILTDNNIGFDIYGAGGGDGMHLCNLALRDLEKRLESGEYVKKYENTDVPETVIFNTPVIKRCVEMQLQCVAIDISNCYWETAHNVGIIGDRLHRMGYNKVDAYKKGRRAAIGSFNAEKITEKYVNGVLVWSTPDAERRRPYNFARVHVINHIFDMAVDICTEIPDAVAMFLTDCFFVHPEYECLSIYLTNYLPLIF